MSCEWKLHTFKFNLPSMSHSKGVWSLKVKLKVKVLGDFSEKLKVLVKVCEERIKGTRYEEDERFEDVGKLDFEEV